ncbi:MAG TPA: outer membrane protein assembly factor BamD [Chitinophagales bacterium]|nr:outer membrane protein assembly factor BamD [Chitinophagales bacterium]
MLLVSASCSNSYQKVTKSTDPDFKLMKAKEYYEQGECMKAIPLFEELIPVYKGTKSIDDIYYKYADCHFRQGDYLIASFHFKNIYDSYPSSDYAEESLYMYAYSYYMLSPEVQLDQTYTEKALEAFQLFINAYPESSKMEECNQFIDLLWKKLETKAFRNASLYLKTRNYRAAAAAFANLLKDYPDTQYAEEASFLVLKSYYLYAMESVSVKQLERFEKATEAYRNFNYRYKESKFAKDAEQLYLSAVEKIEKLKNPN